MGVLNNLLGSKEQELTHAINLDEITMNENEDDMKIWNSVLNKVKNYEENISYNAVENMLKPSDIVVEDIPEDISEDISDGKKVVEEESEPRGVTEIPFGGKKFNKTKKKRKQKVFHTRSMKKVRNTKRKNKTHKRKTRRKKSH